MDLVHQFLRLFTDLTGVLDAFIRDYGYWTYAILFAIVFVETGLVVMPFLPGDSLLFAVGAIAARGGLNVWTLGVVLFTAAVLGDAVNYAIGRKLRERLEGGGKLRFINRKHLDRTHEFYEKYGGKAIILARFVPIVRTFAPFVAGVGEMTYRKFALYNVVGAALWVVVGLGAGWWFGNFEVVQKNFELVLIGIVVVSVLPMGVELVLARRRARRARAAAEV